MLFVIFVIFVLLCSDVVVSFLELLVAVVLLLCCRWIAVLLFVVCLISFS